MPKSRKAKLRWRGFFEQVNQQAVVVEAPESASHEEIERLLEKKWVQENCTPRLLQIEPTTEEPT